MNVGMPQYGMPSGASSGAPYFNGWSPYGGFGQPQQGYGMSSPFGGFGGGYGMSSPFGSFGGGYGMPFQQMPMGGGKGAYSSPFSQFQTPNFAAKVGTTQPQSSSPPSTMQSPTPYNGPQGGAMAPPFSNQNPMMPPMPHDPMPTSPGSPVLGQSGTPTGLIAGQTGIPTPSQSPIPLQPNAPITQAVPPQMMSPVSGPVQTLPQQTFNQTRIPGANSVLPGRNMLIGGYR